MAPSTSERPEHDEPRGSQPGPFEFPRLELPPVPRLGRADGLVEPGYDEPPAQWRSPLSTQREPEDEYRHMVERVAALASGRETAMPAAAPAPPLAPAPRAAPPAEVEVPATVPASRVAAFLVLGCAVLLAWASHMAFSSALLACSALLLAQLSAAAVQTPGARMRLLAGAASVLVSLASAHAALQGFSADAFVAGLFVIVAVAAAAPILGVAQLVLRRHPEAPLDASLHAGWKLRAGALGLTLAAGVQAHRSFSATPDSVVALVVAAAALHVAVRALRTAT